MANCPGSEVTETSVQDPALLQVDDLNPMASVAAIPEIAARTTHPIICNGLFFVRLFIRGLGYSLATGIHCFLHSNRLR